MTEVTETGIIEASPGAIVESTYEIQPQRRTPWLLSVVVFVSIAAALGAGIAHIASQQQQISTKDTRIIALNETVTKLIEENRVLVDNSQVLYDQILQLGEVPQGANPQTIPGPQGTQGLRGIPGIPGEDGADGAQGVPGTPGRDGTDGQDGADGGQGPAGPAGPQGAPGQNGADGRGIASIACTAVDELTITYTDGTTQTVTVPCVP